MNKKIKDYRTCSILCFGAFVLGLLCGFYIMAVIGLIAGIIFLWISKNLKNLPDTIEKTNDRQPNYTQNRQTNPIRQGLDPTLYYVYMNENSKVYHDDLQCRSLKVGYNMITEKEAKRRGFTPCKHCHPQQ